LYDIHQVLFDRPVPARSNGPVRIHWLARQPLGRDFGWLWAAYAVSAYGSGFGFGAFPLIAIRVLHSGPVQVSAISAAGLAVGAVVAVPLGPWVEFRRKRQAMMAADLLRFGSLLTIPAAYAFGWLSFPQLLVVSVIVAAAKIAFDAASGANLKALVKPADLLTASSRLESTSWTALVVGPPLGGAAVGLFGPVVTVAADAVSYLLSACGVVVIRSGEPRPAPAAARLRASDLLDAWQHLLRSPALRPVFLNSTLTGALILGTEPPLAVMMLTQLGFAPWQYTLAFGLPCVGGFIGSRLAAPLAARLGRHRVMIVFGWLRVVWPIGLAFTGRGAGGVVLVIALQFALVTCMGVFNPVYAAYRLEHTEKDRVARTLTAWSISKNLTVAATIALWGGLASLTSPRAAIAVAGILLLATPLLLPRREHQPAPAEPLGVAGRVTAG
jgi:MFS family permease